MAEKKKTLNTVAEYLAGLERDKRSSANKPEPLDKIYTQKPEGLEATTFNSDGSWNSEPLADPTGRRNLAMASRWLPNDDAERMRAEWATNPAGAPPGKLPFISGTPTHEATPGYSSEQPGKWDPDMANAMALGASAARPVQGQPPPLDVPPVPKPRAPVRREVQVRTVDSGAGTAPRAFEPLAQLAPGASKPDRLAGLPEGVATYMRTRSGLQEAQDDSNRRAMGVELASAFNQIGDGIAGAKYDDSQWNHQREAARQPVADFQARTADQRAQEQIHHQQRMDEHVLEQARQHADMETQKFAYQQKHDSIEDQLKREGFAKDLEVAKQRLKGEEYGRWLQRQDQLMRQRESEGARANIAAQKRKDMLERQDEKDLQGLSAATAKAPFGEMQQALEDIDRLSPGLAYGHVPKESPIGFGDRAAQALLPRGAADWAMSDKGKQYATSAANLRDLVSRMRSGAVLNAGEEQHYKDLLSDDKLSDPATAAYGLNAVRLGIAKKLRNTQGGYSVSKDGEASTLDKYEGTGATTYRNPIFASQGETKRQYSASRNQTRVIDTATGKVLRVEEGDTRGR